MLSVSHGNNFDNVERSILKHAKIVKGAMRKAFKDLRPNIKASTKRLMLLPKHGQLYIVYRSKSGRKLKRGRKHIASKRGEPFAWLSGDTFRSMAFRQTGWGNLRFGFQTFQGGFWETHAQRTVLHHARVENHQQFLKDIRRHIMCDIKDVIKGGKC